MTVLLEYNIFIGSKYVWHTLYFETWACLGLVFINTVILEIKKHLITWFGHGVLHMLMELISLSCYNYFEFQTSGHSTFIEPNVPYS